MPFDIDLDVLREFERGLDPRHPEASRIPARVLGYGEISTVLEIEAPGLTGLAFKRLPLFRNSAETERYCAVYDEYNRLLADEVGIHLPDNGAVTVAGRSGNPVVYLVQRQLAAASIGNRVLDALSPQQACALVRKMLDEVRQVWEFNRHQTRVQIAIDSQISNWSLQEFGPARPALEHPGLLYVDTSTPLFRIEGQEQIDPELFLRSAPSFMVWILRRFFLQDVINRYYDPHRNIVDIIAKLYKEQKAHLIPDVITTVNEWMERAGIAEQVKPITRREVDDYYREDAIIWSLYLSMRRFDRYLHTRVRHRPYPYILPGNIKR